MVVIVDGEKCGGEFKRRGYIIKKVTWDSHSSDPAARLVGKAAKWEEFGGDMSIVVSSQYPKTKKSQSRKRQKLDGSIDLAANFNGDIANFDVDDDTSLALVCADCRTSGNLEYEVLIDLNPFSENFGVRGRLTTKNDMGLTLEIDLELTAAFTEEQRATVDLLHFQLAGINVGSLFTLGPFVKLSGVAVILPIEAALTASFGGRISIDDDKSLRVGFDEPSDDIELKFTPSSTRPFFSAAVGIKGEVFLGWTAAFEVSALGFGGSVGAVLKAPRFVISARAEVSDRGLCGNPDAIAGVRVAGRFGAELALFGGAETADNFPNEFTLVEASQRIFDVCFTFEEDGGTDFLDILEGEE